MVNGHAFGGPNLWPPGAPSGLGMWLSLQKFLHNVPKFVRGSALDNMSMNCGAVKNCAQKMIDYTVFN